MLLLLQFKNMFVVLILSNERGKLESLRKLIAFKHSILRFSFLAKLWVRLVSRVGGGGYRK